MCPHLKVIPFESSGWHFRFLQAMFGQPPYPRAALTIHEVDAATAKIGKAFYLRSVRALQETHLPMPQCHSDNGISRKVSREKRNVVLPTVRVAQMTQCHMRLPKPERF